MAVVLKNVGLDQFLELRERKPALEFVDGRITQKVSPKGKHSTLQSGLGELILQFARPRKLAWAYSELRVTFGGNSLVPDLSVYRWSRRPVDPDGTIADDFTEPPDIVVEIVSPRQSRTSLLRRCHWFVANGVAVALLINPRDQSILSFQPNQIPVTLTSSDRIDLANVLPGFTLTAKDVFDLLRAE